jgi:hypothetical protein
MTKRKGVGLTVWFAKNIRSRISRVAKDQGLTMSALVRYAVLRYLDEHETSSRDFR